MALIIRDIKIKNPKILANKITKASALKARAYTISNISRWYRYGVALENESSFSKCFLILKNKNCFPSKRKTGSNKVKQQNGYITIHNTVEI